MNDAIGQQMNFKIGEYVHWTESRYWSTNHPDEAGYEDVKFSGMVISFDAETVVVSSHCGFSGLSIKALNIAETKWKAR
jgi:putative lipase involved disintegration of autophagic bodies